MNSSAPTVNNATKPTTLNQALFNLDFAMSLQPSTPLIHQAQIATADVEAIAVLNTAKAALSAAQAAEYVAKAATQIAEFFPVLTKVLNHLRLTDDMRKRVNDLEVMIAGTLIVVRGNETANQFVELAQIAANVLKSIPISEEPTLQEAVLTLHEGLDTLQNPTSKTPPPVTEILTHSPASSSTTSTNTNETNDATFQADLANLRRFMSGVNPPATPEILRLPKTFHSIESPKDRDIEYRHRLAYELWNTSNPTTFLYNSKEHQMAEVGPPHRPLFLCVQPHGPVVWAANKRALAKAMEGTTYKGLTDSEDDA
jgi:hypothetical protein